MEKALQIERETYKGKDGKEYFGYIVRGEVRGRAVKVDFAPKDIGGYEVLDILFDVSPSASLIMSDEETADKFGNKIRYTSYKAQTIDEDGTPYECDIRPKYNSDKALLKMLLTELNKAHGVSV